MVELPLNSYRNHGVYMKRLTALTLTAAILFTMTACGNKPEPSAEDPVAVTTDNETTEAETVPETSIEETMDPVETPDWAGAWQATDTEEHFEITDVTDEGFKLTFWHFEEGQIEEFIYKMEFDNNEKTIASEIGTAQDHGGWEYTFTFKGDTILVQSKLPDQIYKRAEPEVV